jgi:hypothetical protein
VGGGFSKKLFSKWLWRMIKVFTLMGANSLRKLLVTQVISQVSSKMHPIAKPAD